MGNGKWDILKKNEFGDKKLIFSFSDTVLSVDGLDGIIDMCADIIV